MSPPRPRIEFACARDGLAGTLERTLLGGYDGAGAWLLAVGNIRDAEEQLLVETHEGLHHELQSSTALGLTAAMAIMLSRRNVRPYALADFFRTAVENTRDTHEVFATLLAASVVGLERTHDLLSDNQEYLGHLRRGLRLGGPDGAWRLRKTAAAAVLRCCMAPAGVLGLLQSGFGSAAQWPVRPAGGWPDERLRAFEAADGAARWSRLRAALEEENPTEFRRETDPDRREPPPDAAGLSMARHYDEQVLLRRCYEETRAVLDDAGLPSVPWAEQERVARELRGAVASVDAELAERLSIVTERRPVVDDGLEYDRQGVLLRERLPAQLIDPATTRAMLSAFIARDAEGDPFACGVWLASEVVRKQFSLPDGLELPPTVTALILPARDADVSPVVRLGLLASGTTPRQAQDLLGDVPLVVLTSHYSLTNADLHRLLSRVEPVFVLMDLPVRWHVDDWFRQGAAVRMALTPVEGAGAAIDLLALGVDAAPNLVFLCLGGRVGTSVLAESLRRRYGDRLPVDADLLRADANAVNLVLNIVFASWHLLDQNAVE